MEIDLAQKAILAAINGEWELALQINELILQSSPDDTGAMNRKAKALVELGYVEQALGMCEQVLSVDPYNKIASKCIDKWKSNGHATGQRKPIDPQTFLEEPGKTKIVSLINIGDETTYATLDSGDEVKILHHSHRVCIANVEGKYIGRLPDDLSVRLKQLIEYGNQYTCWIKCVEGREVKVFIREVSRCSKASAIQSFPNERSSFVLESI